MSCNDAVRRYDKQSNTSNNVIRRLLNSGDTIIRFVGILILLLSDDMNYYSTNNDCTIMVAAEMTTITTKTKATSRRKKQYNWPTKNLLRTVKQRSNVFSSNKNDFSRIRSYRHRYLDNGKYVDQYQQHIDAEEYNKQQRRLQLQRNQLEYGIQDTSTKVSCDIAYIKCFANLICRQSYIDQFDFFDWASLSAHTSCASLLSAINSFDLCPRLESDPEAKQLFCDTFSACDPYVINNNNKVDSNTISIADDDEYFRSTDCDLLEECSWPGMHRDFIGDGICHDSSRGGCYNTPICNYDGGDCCPDTCMSPSGSYIECGKHAKYVCRNPNSTNCSLCEVNNMVDDDFFKGCPDLNDDMYEINVMATFGDGLDNSKLSIMEGKSGKEIYEAGSMRGYTNTSYVCLSARSPKCYYVVAQGGTWGREISWDIRFTKNVGLPAVASGIVPMECTFTVSGAPDCPNTCTGRTFYIDDPKNDPNDKESREDMFKCIEERCALQTTVCKADPACVNCYQEVVPESCYSVGAFIAVSDCASCKCTHSNSSEYCITKAAPGIVIDPHNSIANNKYEPPPCTPAEIYQGIAAMSSFGNCSNGFNATAIMLEYNTKFDQYNFGELDRFEACAHAFGTLRDRPATECLQILANAATGGSRDTTQNESKEDVPKELPKHAITSLAKHIYKDGENFCDCAKEASIDCPLCPSFLNVKTLLFEILDACNALDEIDCDAWDEYSRPCRANVEMTFGSKALTVMDDDVCNFISAGCGGAGPFPAFRRLDCYNTIPETSWDFYSFFTESCEKWDDTTSADDVFDDDDGRDIAPHHFQDQDERMWTMNPVPENPPIKKPYVPLEERGSQSAEGTMTGRSIPSNEGSHWVRNILFVCIIGGFAFFVYKKRTDTFSFVRYRRMNGGGSNGFKLPWRGQQQSRYDFGDLDDGTSTGLAMESTSKFQPPTLMPQSSNP